METKERLQQLLLPHSLGSFSPCKSCMMGRLIATTQDINSPWSFDIYHNPNHWANEECALRFIKKIILPYIKAIKEEISKPNQTAIVIFDVFKGQTTAAVYNLLEENDIVYVIIPNGCTRCACLLTSQQRATSEKNSQLDMWNKSICN